MSSEKNACIMTPVFDGARYRHHVCSECKGKIELKQSCYGGVSFYELEGYQCAKIKFCPQCGSEVIRFSDKPIFEAPIDMSPLEIFRKLQWEYQDKARWLYHCYISESHQEKVDELINLVETTEEGKRYYSEAVKLARMGSGGSIDARAIRKLREKFGDDTE